MGENTKGSKNKYLAKNVFLFGLSNIGTKLITFFLVPLYTYALTPEEYGIADLIATLSFLIVPVVTLSIGEAAQRFALDEGADKDKIMNISLMFAVLEMTIGLIIVPIAKSFQSTADYAWTLYLFCISIGFVQIIGANLRGQEKLVSFAIFNLTTTLSCALLNILFLRVFHMGVNGYFLAYILSYFLTTIYGLIACKSWHSVKQFSIDKKLLKAMVAYSVLLIPNTLTWWIINSSDRIMIQGMIGSEANGIYAVAYKIPTILSIVAGTFNTAWCFSAIHESRSEDIEEYTNQTFNVFFSVLTLLTAFLMAVIQPVLKVYVAAEYYEAWKYTPALFMSFYFLSISTFVQAQYTVAKNAKGFLFSGIIGAGVNVVCNFIMIPRIGVQGAAIATALGYAASLVFNVFYARKYMKVRVFEGRKVAQYLLLIAEGIFLFINPYITAAIFVLLCVINWRFFKGLVEYGKKLINRRKQSVSEQ